MVPVDATWFMANSPFGADKWGVKKDAAVTGLEDWRLKRIPGSVHFDLDTCVDPEKPFKHALPSANVFEAYMTELGLRESDVLVLYDKMGIFSVARVWFTMRLFGHRDAYVLDGGMPAWER